MQHDVWYVDNILNVCIRRVNLFWDAPICFYANSTQHTDSACEVVTVSGIMWKAAD